MAHFDFNQRLCYYRLSKAKYYVPLHSPWSSKWHFRWASGQVNRREEKLNIVCQALCCGSSVAWGFFDFWRLAETKPFPVFCVPCALRKRRKQGLFRLFQKRRKREKKREPGLVRDPDLSIFIISKREEREKKREILTDADATAGGSTKLSFLTVLRINGSGTGHKLFRYTLPDPQNDTFVERLVR